jgi:hypothetical protein
MMQETILRALNETPDSTDLQPLLLTRVRAAGTAREVGRIIEHCVFLP